MALSKSQKMALYRILGVPWYPSIYPFQDKQNQVVMALTISAGERSAITKLESYISGVVEADVDFETQIKVVLDRWLSLGTKNWSLQGGAVGSVQGMTFSPALERQEIERQIRIWIPFFRDGQLPGDVSGSASRYIPVKS
jgi:hypothetical protein